MPLNKKPKLVPPTKERSKLMQSIRGTDTKPELMVRSFLKQKRFVFETYTDLPGRPDIVLPKKKIIIRVMGCFWHGHTCKEGNRKTKVNTDYWTNKIQGNRARDKRNKAALKKLGWKVVDIWNCHMNREKWEKTLLERIKR